MGEAAWDIARQGNGIEDADLVRRLLVPPGWLSRRPERLPEPEPADADIDAVVAHLEAENRVMKAVIRSEREQSAELRARIDALANHPAAEDVRADRDRWASLVERLLFTGR